MNTKNLLLSVFVILTIVFASLTCVEYGQVSNLSAQLRSRTLTTQTVVTSQEVTTYYDSSSVIIPVPCCMTIPTNFVVGSQNGNTYAFNVMSCAPCIVNGATVTMARVTFKVYQTNALPLRTELANFTWGGTFGESVPYQTNATLFDGAVKMNWFVNSSMLYLHITTK